MIRVRRLLSRARDDDRGSGYLAAFLVLFATLTLGGVGVLVDSARIVSAERHTAAAAFEAARAGAQAVEFTSTRSGAASIDTAAATDAAARAAAELVAGSGATVQSVEIDSDEVLVTIVRHVDPWFPVLTARTITETGRARLAVGITEEGQ